jgi:prepilin-type N-terminal cleavage/methylation domain-containing protein
MTTTTTTNQALRGDAGFSLIETMIAMAILATGLLSMAGVFIMGLGQLGAGSASLIAREKAREAVESVHTARDTRTIQWCQIQNDNVATCADGSAGVFLTGAKPLNMPGLDGLVNTDDDDDAGVEFSLGPGPDNILGTDDDTRTPLTNYTRQIEITPIMLPSPPSPANTPNPSLRRLRVTIGYTVGKTNRTYTLTTFISAIS